MSEPDLSTGAAALLDRIKRLEEKVASISSGNFVPVSNAQNLPSQDGKSADEVKADTENLSRPSDIPPWEDAPQNNANLQDEFSENSNSQNFEPAKPKENAQIPSEASESATGGEIPEEKAQNQTNKNASLKKIAASWGEVINRSIKDGELTVYFALKDTAALDGNGILTIKVQDEEKRATILTNKEKIREFIIKIFGTKPEIKAEVSGKTHTKKDTTAEVFDKLDKFSKQFPQNFTSEGQ